MQEESENEENINIDGGIHTITSNPSVTNPWRLVSSAAGGLITAATHSTAAIQTTLSMAAGGGVNSTAETNTVGVATMNHVGQFHLQPNQNSQNVVSLSC